MPKAEASTSKKRINLGTLKSSQTNRISNKTTSKATSPLNSSISTTPKISKFFRIRNKSNEREKTKTMDADDDFQTPKILTATTSRLSRVAKKKYDENKQKKIGQHNIVEKKKTREEHQTTDVDPDELQMALALSVSMAAENDNNDVHMHNVMTTLERYGFRSDKRQLPVTNKRQNVGKVRTLKGKRLRGTTCFLNTYTLKERSNRTEYKVATVLSYLDTIDYNVREYEVRQDVQILDKTLTLESLQSIKRKECNVFQKSDQTDVDYYVSVLNISRSNARIDCLLRDWNHIPGRDASPVRVEKVVPPSTPDLFSEEDDENVVDGGSIAIDTYSINTSPSSASFFEVPNVTSFTKITDTPTSSSSSSSASSKKRIKTTTDSSLTSDLIRDCVRSPQEPRNCSTDIASPLKNESVSDEESSCDELYEDLIEPLKSLIDIESVEEEEDDNGVVDSDSNVIENETIRIKYDNVTPVPDYESMSSPMIVDELRKYGVRPLRKRKGIDLLKYIYESTHPIIINGDNQDEYDDGTFVGNDIFKKSKSHDYDANDLIFERRVSKKFHGCRVPLQIVWDNFLTVNPRIMESVLLYEPIQLEVVNGMLKEQGYNFRLVDLLTFFDKKCITVRTLHKY